MAISGQQAGYAASKGLNWADPTDPNFGKAGYTGQAEYDAYTQQYGPGASGSGQSGQTSGQTMVTPIDLGPMVDTGTGTATHQPAPATAPAPTAPTNPFPSLPAGATPPPGYRDPSTGATAPTAGTLTPTGPTAPPTTAPGMIPSGTTPTTTPATDEATAQLLDALFGRIHPGTVDQNNPAIAGAIGANNLALQRGAEAQRAQQAESNAAAGIDSSGGANAINQGILEDMSAKQGQFAGTAVQHEADLQNQNAQQTLGILASFLGQQAGRQQQESQFERSLSEQQKEALAEEAIKQSGIDVQKELGVSDIQLRQMIASGQLNLGTLSTLLDYMTKEQGLGLQQGEFNAGQDTQTLLGILSGLGA